MGRGKGGTSVLQSEFLLIYVGIRVVQVTFSCSNCLFISNSTYANLILLEYCGVMGMVVGRGVRGTSVSQSALLLIHVGVRVVPVTFSCSNYLCISNPTYGNLILLEYCGGGDGGGEGGEAHLYHRARCCC